MSQHISQKQIVTIIGNLCLNFKSPQKKEPGGSLIFASLTYELANAL